MIDLDQFVIIGGGAAVFFSAIHHAYSYPNATIRV